MRKTDIYIRSDTLLHGTINHDVWFDFSYALEEIFP
jgi:hypothetical protein